MITRATDLNSDYAPIYITRANVIHQKAISGEMSFDVAINEQQSLFEQAKSMEEDLAESANLNRLARERYLNYGLLKEAIDTSEEYVENAPMISTYLRDRKEDAEAFAKFLRSSLGYSAQVSPFFKDLLDQNPQNFDYRLMYADVLKQGGRMDEALDVLEEGQRILASADNELPSYSLRIALINFDNGEEDKAEEVITSLSDSDLGMDEKLLLAQLYANLGRADEGTDLLDTISGIDLPIDLAEYHFVQGMLAEANDNTELTEEHYTEALELNLYHVQARVALIDLLSEQDENDRVSTLTEEAEELPIQLGPDFDRLVQ